MRFAAILLLFLVAGCGENDRARSEKLRQEAIAREVEAKVMARTSPAKGDEAVSPLRVIVYGFTAAGGLLLLHLLGAPRMRTGDDPLPHPEDRSQRSGGRVLDLNRHENPPRH